MFTVPTIDVGILDNALALVAFDAEVHLSKTCSA